MLLTAFFLQLSFATFYILDISITRKFTLISSKFHWPTFLFLLNYLFKKAEGDFFFSSFFMTSRRHLINWLFQYLCPKHLPTIHNGKGKTSQIRNVCSYDLSILWCAKAPIKSVPRQRKIIALNKYSVFYISFKLNSFNFWALEIGHL